MKKNTLFTLIALLFLSSTFAQSNPDNLENAPGKKKKHSFYFSWGYNTEWYTNSDINVKQPGLANNYILKQVDAHDHKGWDHDFFAQELTIPQYNYRIGYMIDEERGLGIELNFDHTKYIIANDQNIHIKGTIEGRPIDTSIFFSDKTGFYYYLNNGANFFLINFVKRWSIIANKKQTIRLDGYGKIGVGPVVPHVENSFFGKPNDPHFQIGGWNTGIEGAFRATFFRFVYLEYANKLVYARYSGLKVYEGKARQNFGVYEMILNLGISIPPKRKS